MCTIVNALSVVMSIRDHFKMSEAKKKQKKKKKKSAFSTEREREKTKRKDNATISGYIYIL